MNSVDLLQAQCLYAEKGMVTFGLSLAAQKNKDGRVKKQVKPPLNFPQFQLENLPQIKSNYNALGLLCGQKNGIIVIDIDNPSHFDQFLKDCDASVDFNSMVIQDTANGGYHLIFKYETLFDSVKVNFVNKFYRYKG